MQLIACVMKHHLKLYLFGLLFCSFSQLFSQNNISYKFDKITAADFIINSPLVDSNASAVIIADVGKTEFVGNEKGWFTYVFKRKKRIKIINKTALDLGTVEISLYNDDEDMETAEDIVATTYNLKDGQIIIAKLDKKQIFKETHDKKHSAVKFALPGVIDGSIIEYSYTIKSNFTFNIPSWEFQAPEYPTLWSEYNVAIPSLLIYMSLRQGSHSFFVENTVETSQNYMVKQKVGMGFATTEQSLNVTAPVYKKKWIMKDLPSLKYEKFLTSPYNYIEKIDFQLYQTSNGEQTTDAFTTWEKASEEMIKRKDFIGALYDDDGFFARTNKEIVNFSDPSEKQIKDIYYYIQKNISCNNRHKIFITTSLKDILKRKSGNASEINLLLIGLLRDLGLVAEPVILSKRENGKAYEKYPQADQYNYLICRAEYNNKEVFLDASVPLLGFGKLPLNCYNGFAKEISKQLTPYHFNPEDINEKSSSFVFLNNDKNGISGTIAKNFAYYESMDLRKEISATSEENYKTKLRNEITQDNIKLNNIKIDSLSQTEAPITVHADLSFQLNSSDDLIYFYPIIDQAIKTNPFVAADREYPVELPFISETVFTLNMEMPVGYKVDELPKQLKVKLNEDDGMFEYLVAVIDNRLEVRCKLKINKATFGRSVYQDLRDFYALVVKKEAEPIVFKKIKK